MRRWLNLLVNWRGGNSTEPAPAFALPCPTLPAGFSHADLGCGARKATAAVLGHPTRKADIGIDVTRSGTEADILCRLGLEDIPLESNSQDLVTAIDVLEHIPKVCVVSRDGADVYAYPAIRLFNEIHRILKPGGYFESLTPGIPNYWTGFARDPTHVSPYCLESFDYFCPGRFEAVSRSYGVTGFFEKVHVGWLKHSHIQAVMRKT
jgi:SAM-dependent methyltransferase